MKIIKYQYADLRRIANVFLKDETYEVENIGGWFGTVTITRPVQHYKRMKRLITSASTREEARKRIQQYILAHHKPAEQLS